MMISLVLLLLPTTDVTNSVTVMQLHHWQILSTTARSEPYGVYTAAFVSALQGVPFPLAAQKRQGQS